jgi:hypothetical protein
MLYLLVSSTIFISSITDKPPLTSVTVYDKKENCEKAVTLLFESYLENKGPSSTVQIIQEDKDKRYLIRKDSDNIIQYSRCIRQN